MSVSLGRVRCYPEQGTEEYGHATWSRPSRRSATLPPLGGPRAGLLDIQLWTGLLCREPRLLPKDIDGDGPRSRMLPQGHGRSYARALATRVCCAHHARDGRRAAIRGTSLGRHKSTSTLSPPHRAADLISGRTFARSLGVVFREIERRRSMRVRNVLLTVAVVAALGVSARADIPDGKGGRTSPQAGSLSPQPSTVPQDKWASCCDKGTMEYCRHTKPQSSAVPIEPKVPPQADRRSTENGSGTARMRCCNEKTMAACQKMSSH